MSETIVVTLRLPKRVKRGVERLAARFGHKPAQLGARLIEEGLRRRDFPQIDLRETAPGRVAYVAGTRLAVHWVVEMVPQRMTVEEFTREYALPVERVRAALTYARAFQEEIESDHAHAEENRGWIEAGDGGAKSSRRKEKSDQSAVCARMKVRSGGSEQMQSRQSTARLKPQPKT